MLSGIHLANGLYDAAMDRQPVIAITGHTYHDLIGTYEQQDVALDRLFQEVAVYSERIRGLAHVENAVDEAFRVSNRHAVLRALELYAGQNLDFGDAMIVASMEQAGSNVVFSHDTHFDRILSITRRSLGSAFPKE